MPDDISHGHAVFLDSGGGSSRWGGFGVVGLAGPTAGRVELCPITQSEQMLALKPILWACCNAKF